MDDPHNHNRRQEVIHGGATEEELPHKKKSTGSKHQKHEHKWTYRFGDSETGRFYECVICGRWKEGLTD